MANEVKVPILFMVSFWMTWEMIGVGYAQQRCANSGDPIVHITFGNADSPMTRLQEGTTDYQLYQGGTSFMRPNQYTITHDAQTAGQVFHRFTDHTGDQAGGMLLVNADYQPGVFYTEVQRDLCPNTDFTFSAWVINASPPDLCGTADSTLKPNVLFEIRTLSGEQIGELSTGVIEGQASPQWRYFEVSFNTGNNTDVVLVMRNNGPGGCGNNLAIDDIQFRPCGPDLTLQPSLPPAVGNTVLLCAGVNEVTLGSNIGPGYDVPVYQWQERSDTNAGWVDIPGATTPSLTVGPVEGTSYRLAVAANAASLGNPKCRVVSDVIRVAQAQAPRLPLIPIAQSRCLHDNQPLDPEAFTWPDTGPLTYQWYERDGNSWVAIPGADASTFTPLPPEAGLYAYQRRAINSCGVDFPVNEFEIDVRPLVEASLRLPMELLCEDGAELLLTGGSPELFDGQAGQYDGPGVENGVFYPDRSGVGSHTIRYSPPAGSDCPAPATATITVIEAVYVEPMADQVILKGDGIRLNPKTNATHFAWEGSDPGLSDYTSAGPLAAPLLTTTYSLTVANAAGCEQTTTVTVRVLEPLVIPNSFTPNGDGVNDVWEIVDLAQYPNAVLQVFNRWGKSVFFSKGYAVPWDGTFNGTSLPVGAYYYTLSSAVLQRPIRGAITILR
ncbi:gliding motility-associated C-terminal domain-containing protein [Parapedobacter sp. DT-150]|uniref:gliding motility-associated C-terminal domain-containing protein n=1 Tax=Parapedobacter sp. DT-150 TaxID=3396162 RepID=UPI003F1E1B73